MPRLLLIEDNEMNRDMLARRLTRRGYDMSLATDGQEGLDMATASTPDLVILDLRLPKLDGIEVVRRLKGNPATQAIPVVVLTANALADTRRACRAAGGDAFETKPVDFKRLTVTIERLLDGRDAQDADDAL